jgi:hypothetical protein
MKSIQVSTLSKKKYLFNILDFLQAEIEVAENHFDLPIEELFTMAARINKKRSFLFVSKLIGKHIPINPNKGLLTSALMAVRYYEEVIGMEYQRKEELLSSFKMDSPSFSPLSFIPTSHSPVIIGFAETATALGQAFFDCFEGADYFHTTRESLYDQTSVIAFEEEHSHATSHRCYIPQDLIQNDKEIILVDDELTTGKTALNIIRSIHSKFPRSEYSIVSILDWRTEEDKQEFKQIEQSLGITIHVVSLIAGSVHVKQLKNPQEPNDNTEMISETESSIEFLSIPEIFSMMTDKNPPYLKETGRFGIQHKEKKYIYPKISEVAAFLEKTRVGEKTLCLGTGEFMYLPMKIASEMGSGIFYHSTTRSPIYIQNELGYGVRFGASFPNPEDKTVSHFVYNIPPDFYDDLFLFFEREVEYENLEPLLRELKQTRIKSIKIVFFAKKGRDFIE